ncbi:hypothetical protein [Cellulomonas hominis]
MAGEQVGEDIIELGIVVTKYRAASSLHNATIKRLQDGAELPIVFETQVPEGNAIAASAEFSQMSTLRQKYAYQGGYEVFRALAKEFIEAAEAIS